MISIIVEVDIWKYSDWKKWASREVSKSRNDLDHWIDITGTTPALLDSMAVYWLYTISEILNYGVRPRVLPSFSATPNTTRILFCHMQMEPHAAHSHSRLFPRAFPALPLRSSCHFMPSQSNLLQRSIERASTRKFTPPLPLNSWSCEDANIS